MLKPGLLGAQWDEYINPSDLDGTRVDDGSAAVNDGSAASGSGANSTPSSSIWDDLLDAGEKIWTSPNTALGVIAGMAGVPFGAKPSFEHGAVVFNDYPWQVHGGGAVTLGNAILSNFPSLDKDVPTYMANYNANTGTPDNPFVKVGNHEEGHVHQGGALGPFYLPTYVLQSIFSDGPSPMEKAADTYGQTGKGWWPW
jgi:hypothetical protein